MTTKNDITGDALKSKPSSDKYRENWERIFGQKKKDNKKKTQKNSCILDSHKV